MKRTTSLPAALAAAFFLFAGAAGTAFAAPRTPGHAVKSDAAATSAVAPAPDYRDAAQDGPSFMSVDAQGRTWAVWSYRRGLEVDVAVSRAIGRTWTSPEIVGSAGTDDLDPRIGFRADGTPVLVWWQAGAEAGQGRVLAAVLENGRWSAPVPVAEGVRPALFFTANGLTLAFVDLEGTLRSLPLEPQVSRGTYTYREPPDTSNGPDPLPTVVTK